MVDSTTPSEQGREAVPIGVQVDGQLWNQFRQDVKGRKGRIRGHLSAELERAIREYINASQGGDTHDRLTRIESTLEDIQDTLAESDRKKEDSDIGTTVEKRADEIDAELDELTGGDVKVADDIVELAIEKHAGDSDPTLRKYKQRLKQRGRLFDHPSKSDHYFRDEQEWVVAVQQLRQNEAISQGRYAELVREYGEDEFTRVYQDWKEQHTDSAGRGVQ